MTIKRIWKNPHEEIDISQRLVLSVLAMRNIGLGLSHGKINHSHRLYRVNCGEGMGYDHHLTNSLVIMWKIGLH